MKILAVLQNQWFKDPEAWRRSIERHPHMRRRMIAFALFRGCLTGRRLKAVFGEDLCHDIVWEEASPHIGGHASSAFPADIPHLKAMLTEIEPNVVLAFGRIASDALTQIVQEQPLLVGPHPAARGAETLPRMHAMKKELDRLCN